MEKNKNAGNILSSCAILAKVLNLSKIHFPNGRVGWITVPHRLIDSKWDWACSTPLGAWSIVGTRYMVAAVSALPPPPLLSPQTPWKKLIA